MIPDLKQSFTKLIAASSISSLDATSDQGNLEVIELLESWCKTLGFCCQVTKVINSRNKYNLLASLNANTKSTGGLLLAGHTDTVPFSLNGWQSNPLILTEKDDKWYGLGTCDMKGFFALILSAIEKIGTKNISKPLYIFASADEETTMEGAKQFANAKNIAPEYAIIGEPTSLKPIHMHKGYVSKGIRIVGKSGHSSDPDQGVNAIEIMNLIISELMKLKKSLKNNYNEPNFLVPHPTINLGCIHGGDAVNRICAFCELQLDVRPLPSMSLEDLESLLVTTLYPITKKYPNAITIMSLCPSSPAFYADPTNNWSSLIANLTNSKPAAVNYATEAPYIQKLGCQTIVLGPGNIAQAHQPNEHIDLNCLKPSIELFSNLIYHACKIKS